MNPPGKLDDPMEYPMEYPMESHYWGVEVPTDAHTLDKSDSEFPSLVTYLARCSVGLDASWGLTR